MPVFRELEAPDVRSNSRLRWLVLGLLSLPLTSTVAEAKTPGANPVRLDSAGQANAPSAVQPDPTVSWQPWSSEALDGSPLPGELGRLTVPENHDLPDGATIDLAFVRYRTSHPNPGPPIFFLSGGPGGSGVEGGAVIGTHPQIRLLQQRDVVAVDQRGTGLTEPNLMTAVAIEELPLDRPLERSTYIAALQESARKTVAYWRRKGIDPRTYNSAQSAHDLDAVRRALGYEKVALYGSSYGSHLGLAYLRYHGEHVERAVLSKVEGPNHTYKLPSIVQRHLENLHQRVAEHPAWRDRLPDLLGTVHQLLDRLRRQPVVTSGEADDSGPPVTLGPLDLQIELARSLAAARDIAAIPAELLRFTQGDWTALAAAARENRRIDLPPMTLMMDCASGADPDRRQRLAEETVDNTNLLADAILAPFYPESCAAIGELDVGTEFRSAFRSEVPVLFVSGSLDVRTPVENVEEILGGFTNGVHVKVENAGHPGREQMSPDFRGLLQAFLRGEAVESCTITLPKPILLTDLEHKKD